VHSIVGVDIDGGRRKMLQCYFNAKQFGEVTVMETRHGYHLYILVDRELTVEENFYMRRVLGDDWQRLQYDELKRDLGLIDFIDTLFVTKRERDGSTYHVKEIDPLTPPMYVPRQVFKR